MHAARAVRAVCAARAARAAPAACPAASPLAGAACVPLLEQLLLLLASHRITALRQKCIMTARAMFC